MKMIECFYGGWFGNLIRVFKEWKMAENRHSNAAVMVQTIILVITLLGIAIAADRRVTTVEGSLKSEIEIRKTLDEQHTLLIQKMQSTQQNLVETQARITTLLEVISQRHTLEDSRRMASR